MVIGDVMVDAYLFGKVDRISPEAPVPIVNVDRRVNRLGGAANVALNLKAIGVTPVLCSVIGHDKKGDEFLELLREEQIGAGRIFRSPGRITTTKFRVIGNNVQMIRVDEEATHDLSGEEESKFLEIVNRAMEQNNIQAIIFQDYNKGTLTEKIIHMVIEMALLKGIPVVADPKKKNFHAFRDIDLFKPNLKELREGLNMEVNYHSEASLERAADLLHEEQGVRMVMVTLSDAGVFISEVKKDGGKERFMIPAHKRSIADVSGAGDTVVSVATACLAAGMGARQIALISNLAGGLVCEEVGVAPVNMKRLVEELNKLPLSGK